MTAAAADQESWSHFDYTYTADYAATGHFTVTESTSYSYFTRGLTRAGGWDGITGKNQWTRGTRTLAKVYSEVAKYCKKDSAWKSDVQVFPSGSSYVLFSR